MAGVRRLLPLMLLATSSCLPGFGSEPNSVLQEVPERPTYREIAQITANYCLRCHNQSNAQGEFDGDTYATLYPRREDARDLIDAGIMPPLTEAPMSLIDRATFIKWVDIGAPNVETQDTQE